MHGSPDRWFEEMIKYLIVKFSARMSLSIYQYFERKEDLVKENL
jgi:hypothetical protein